MLAVPAADPDDDRSRGRQQHELAPKRAARLVGRRPPHRFERDPGGGRDFATGDDLPARRLDLGRAGFVVVLSLAGVFVQSCVFVALAEHGALLNFLVQVRPKWPSLQSSVEQT